MDLAVINSDTEEGRELCQLSKVRLLVIMAYPRVDRRVQVCALPTVVASQGGEVVKTFTGALREHRVRQFLRETRLLFRRLRYRLTE